MNDYQRRRHDRLKRDLKEGAERQRGNHAKASDPFDPNYKVTRLERSGPAEGQSQEAYNHQQQSQARQRFGREGAYKADWDRRADSKGKGLRGCP